MTRRTLPEIRERLHVLAREIEPRFPGHAGELHLLAEETRREYSGRRAPPRSLPVTDELAEQVLAYAAATPRASHVEIGLVYGINPGRVSEILFGKRGER